MITWMAIVPPTGKASLNTCSGPWSSFKKLVELKYLTFKVSDMGVAVFVGVVPQKLIDITTNFSIINLRRYSTVTAKFFTVFVLLFKF